MNKEHDKSKLVLLLAAVLFLSAAAYAKTYSYDLSGEFYIWDISGTYSDDSMGCTIWYTITQDAKGKITGFGDASCYISGVDIDMTFDIKGSVKQQNGVCSVVMSMRFTGTATVQSQTFRFRASERICAQINNSTGIMDGIVKVCVSIAGYGYCETVSFSASVPVDMDGSSQLDFNTSQAGRKLIGTGTLELSNGETYTFTVMGSYNEKKDLTTFTLKGCDSAKGCNLKIIVPGDGTSGDIDSLKGKVLGQCIK